MKIVGLIAEYNPFHNGHLYHINVAREVAQADAVIIVMSGNYVQRGMPAIMPKHLRAEAALREGADVVIELPVCYATGTAEQFAYGAVSLLDKLGCVDALCFGSECGKMEILKEVASTLYMEPKLYKEKLKEYLHEGCSFPKARQRAFNSISYNRELPSVLEEPNNTLGIEYLKALYRTGSKMKPYTILRQTSRYHDTELQDTYSSASAIREVLLQNDFSGLNVQIPAAAFQLIKQLYGTRYPVVTNDFSLLLKHRLLQETKASLSEYADVSDELANRIINQRNQFMSFDQFCELLKSKEITYSRISRALLHILLCIKKSDYDEIDYARLLGFREESANVLAKIKRCSSIPLISKLKAMETLSYTAQKMLQKDIIASDLYESVITDKFGTAFINEYEHQIIRI